MLEEVVRDTVRAVQHNPSFTPVQAAKIIRKTTREMRLFRFENLDKPEKRREIEKLLFSRRP